MNLKAICKKLSICTAFAVLLTGGVTLMPAQSPQTAAAAGIAATVAAAPITGTVTHNFTTQGAESSYFDIVGNLSTGKGTMTYNGETLTQCLKMESSTSISFTTAGAATMNLAIQDGTTIYVDGVKYDIQASGITTVPLTAGDHTITKGSGSSNLFYIEITADEGGSAVTTAPAQSSTQTSTATTAAPNVTPVSGAIYCSPNGNGSGSLSDPMSVTQALSSVKAGGTIFCLEGTYKFSATILIDESNSGTSGAMKTISAAPGAKVTFDFSALDTADSNRGVVLDGDYWHWYGIKIQYAGDNGMLLAGSNNIIEMCEFYNNQDTGLQISRYKSSDATIDTWPSNNIILNCSSHDNCDDATMENADGFAAKLTCGEGNIFDGCMSYNNSDDGWDLYAKEATGPIGVVTIQNCIAFRNGYTSDGRGYGDCDGNGFKLGGGGVGTAHIVKNCLAFENLNCGFTDNNNPLLGKIENCTAVNNSIGGNGKPNFSVYRCTNCDFDNLMSYYNDSSIKIANDKYVGTYANGVYYNSGYYLVTSDTAVSNNEKIGTKFSGPTDVDFISLSAPAMGADIHTLWRNADGSLNTGGAFETVGTYSSMGSHLDGAAQVISPSVIVPAASESTTTATTTTAAETTTTTVTTTVSSVTETTVSSSSEEETETTAAPAGILLGDVDCSGDLSISDAILLSRLSAEDSSVQVSDQGMLNANCNADDTVDVADVVLLLQWLAGIA